MPRDAAARSVRPPRTTLRSLSSGPPTGVFRRLEALTETIEVVAARRTSSSPPEPCPDSDGPPYVETAGQDTGRSTPPDRH